ncbi:polyketide synthase [Lentithecium fluviatile CBS 122367]|uniref:Polyketide synthase n=1 Tax=Lentithecium fluviatile CBS 122367 TaxID=1168545 RepID=A0A6G1IE46_9PLEO|nr:polyketide synthase [Lentithecium fluviatile CBS 122367]
MSPATDDLVPIAIIGMGMRLPGGCHDSNAFWEMLMDKREGMIPIPESRWSFEGFHDPSGKPGTVKPTEGNFLGSLDPAAFDAAFFSMSASQVEQVDPQQRLLLETVYESLENAGERDFRGKNIGVYVGTFAEDWIEMHAKDAEPHAFLGLTGHLDLMTSNRVSYEFDWTGPSMTIKTGCSAAMVALDSACKALRSGDCESAIVGGTNLILSPALSCVLNAHGVNSPEGRCRSFDAKAAGYGRAEAVSSLVVKRLDDAVRDGNPIRAVIRASLCNADGKTPGITQPNTEAHEKLIRAVYTAAGISREEYSQTAYFECHGTGTPVGDPIEVNAVARVFGDDGMIIGSVKSNVGHSEAASGNTSVIKAVLALENRIIPPNVNFETPNPKIPWKEAKLTVPVEAMEWPTDRLERVSVNSFGIGGSNAHVILESAASYGVKQSMTEDIPAKPLQRLLLFTAKSEKSLQASVQKYTDYVDQKGSSCLKDMAYTLASRRQFFEHRTFSVTDGQDRLSTQSISRTKDVPKSLIFAFTGQGAQWAEMGKCLMDDIPSFREDLQKMDGFLVACQIPPSWRIADELSKPKLRSQLSKAEFSQPLCTAIQIALVNLFERWGIKPNAVVGHSSGEIAAAYAAGGITMKDAILAAYFRGLATKEKLAEGGMAAVGLGSADVRPYLIPGVVVACENSPSSTTVSGDRAALDRFVSNLQRDLPNVFVRHLLVDQAYHSHQMQPYGATYQESINGIHAEDQPTIPFFSTVTGKVIDKPGQLTASYWRKNLESPVLFHTGVRNIIKANFPNPVCLELGPHSALAGPLRQIFQAEDAQLTYIPTLQRNKDDTQSIYSTIGNLWLNNIAVNFDALNPDGSVLTDLPTYSWDHSVKYWEENRPSQEWRLRKFLPHDTLGTRLPGSSHLEPTWRNILRLDEVQWVRDHIVGTDIVFPAAGYICMAGEAIRQLTGRSDYMVRGLSVRTAMIVAESKANDVITTFKKAKLTNTTDSDWWEFRITSFNGSTWSEHCSGQAKAGPSTNQLQERHVDQPDYVRKVSASRWYSTMQKIGFTYGPSFQGLRDISADPIKHDAVGTVDNIIREGESFYELHPTILDKVLQLMTVTQHQGKPSAYTQLSMPTYIQEIYISGGMKELRITASSCKDFMDAWSGDAIATAEGKIVFEMKGLSVTALGDDSRTEEKPKNAVQLVWEPHADLNDLTSLIRAPLDLRVELLALEKYFFLLALDTVKVIADIDTKEEHFAKFRTWLNRFVETTSNGENSLLREGKELALMGDRERQSLFKSMTEQFKQGPVPMVATALRRVHENAEYTWKGSADTLQILMEDNILTQIYAFFDLEWDYSALLQSLGHCKPTLRVLEIGAGTGGTTTNMLAGLRSTFGERLYSHYTYTDISPGFFVAAKERFKDHPNISFSVLDISKDPLEQGFEAESFDLILAANVIHATPVLQDSLRNVKKLLHPKGRLLLQELDIQANWMGFIMGGFSGWWLGDAEGRDEKPFVSPERWDAELKAAGCSGVDFCAYDNDPPYQVTATMLSSVATPPPEKKRLTFLHLLSSPVATIDACKRKFELAGHAVDTRTLEEGSTLPPSQDIVCLLEIDAPFFDGVSKSDFECWIKLAAAFGTTTNVLWLTHTTSMGKEPKDPRYAQVLGFARTLRSEKHTSFTTLEIDDFDRPDMPGQVLRVYENIGRGDNDSELDPDFEFALSEGTIYSSRYHWFSVGEALATTMPRDVDKVLKIGQKGMIDSIRYEKNDTTSGQLKGREVAVKPHTVGVNFRDVLQTQGLIDGDDLGGESSGVVEAIGPDVTDFAVGDRVFMMVPYCFSNRVITTEELVAKIPEGLSSEDAATMPIVYITVIYALLHLRRLQKDEIYATVGNQEKVEFLMKNFGIPRAQIFDSHNISFRDDLLKATNGRGVDVALNSLAGALLHATWQCIAPFGAMMEIGKRDFYGHASLDMVGFTENKTFIGIDARHMEAERPALCGQLLRECASLYEQGHIQPIRPIKNFQADEIADAFRFMQRGTHIGKLTVRMPDDFTHLATAPGNPDLALRPDASYFLVGGLGGIGRSLALWLVENGARHLVFLSRAGRSSTVVEDFCQELEVLGCQVQVFAGSVVNPDDVRTVAKQAAKPIRGVLQLSMVLQDRAIETMTYDDWTAAIGPKVDGTWNLHHALPDLDWFVMFSSVSGLMGQFGQANYAAANCFLDAFAQYRHARGLPASVIDLGVAEDVGFVSSNTSLIDYFKFLSANLLSERDIADIVRLAIARSSPASTEFTNASQLTVGVASYKPLSDPGNRIIWKRDRRFAVYRNMESSAQSGGVAEEGLKALLAQIARDGSGARSSSGEEPVEYLAKEMGKTLYGFMMRDADDMDLDQALATLGLDSLVGIELRNWCRQQLGLEISILEMMQSTLRGLGKKAVEMLLAKH